MLSGLENMTVEQGTDAQQQDLQLDEAEGEEGASGAEGEEDEAAEPAAKHGWNKDEARKEALPEAGPQGLASESAAAQVRPHLRCAEEACSLCASHQLARCQNWVHACHSRNERYLGTCKDVLWQRQSARQSSAGQSPSVTPLNWLCRLQLRSRHQQLKARVRKKQKQQARSKATRHR